MLQLKITLKLSEDRDIINWLTYLPDSQHEQVIRDILRTYAKSSPMPAPVNPAQPLEAPEAAATIIPVSAKNEQNDDLDDRLSKILDQF